MAIELKSYIVSFIDLLGFSAMVQHDCESPNGNQRFIESLYEIHLETKKLKDTIRDLQLIQFSDSVVFAIPYSVENYKKIIEIVSRYQYELLHKGILCRGGVSYGKHFSTEDFLFSNGMIEAYRLESTVASTPRVVVSNELMELVHPSNSQSPNDTLIKEQDGVWFVNYLDGNNHEKDWDAINQAIPAGLSKTPSIRNKQIWLIDYYNHIHPEFVRNEIPQFSTIPS